MNLESAIKPKKIGVYLPTELLAWCDKESPTNRSRLIVTALEVYRVMRVLSNAGPIVSEIESRIPEEKRGGGSMMDKWLMERARLDLMNLEQTAGRHLRITQPHAGETDDRAKCSSE